MLMTARGQVSLPDPATLRRFDVPGPRYTSYPTADRFVEAFETHAFAEALAARETAVAAASLSLYVHLPFCSTRLLLLCVQQGHHQGPEQVRRIHRLHRA